MPDNQFDNFFNEKLNDRPAPVPDGLWDKLMDKQFDEFVGGKLKDNTSPVPEGLWDKVTDGQLDNFFGAKLSNYAAPVPTGLWDKITDGGLDQFVGDKLANFIAPVPAGLWDKVTDSGFDQFFAGKLANYTAPVPAGLWEKVRPEEKEDRKVFFLLRIPAAAIFILALLFGGTAAYFWLQPKDGVKTAPDSATGTSPHTSTSNPKENTKELKEIPATTAIVPTEIPDNGPQPVTNATTIEARKEGHPAQLKANPTTGLTKEGANDQTASSTLPNTTVGNSKNNRLHGNPQNTDRKNGSIPGAPNNNLETKNTNAVPQFTLHPTAESSVDSTAADGNLIALLPFQPAFLPANTIPSGLNRKGWMMDLTGKELNKPASLKGNIICPTNRSNRNTDWLLEAFVSPDLAFKSVSNNSASAQFLRTKDSSEHMQVGFTAGVRIVKPLNDNFLLKTGLQYSQINQSYAYRTENEIKTTTVVTVRTIIRAPGDTVVVSDTSVLQTIGFKNNTVKNRFRSIDIPVIVGYQFGDEDLKFGINAGVIFNMSSWYQGVILDTASLSVVPLTKSNDMVYKSKLGLGLYAGFSITKQLSEDMHIFFEPYFRYNLSNMTSAQSSYNQKFSIGGLNIGLRFNLNRQ